MISIGTESTWNRTRRELMAPTGTFFKGEWGPPRPVGMLRKGVVADELFDRALVKRKFACRALHRLALRAQRLHVFVHS